MLKIQLIDGINPFEWQDFTCPLCEGREFTSIAHAGVYCDDCNCRFVVRDTAGDPGCVVDCLCTKDQGGYVYAPTYFCEKCDANNYSYHGLFDWQDKTCPLNLHHGAMTRKERCHSPWKMLKNHERFCLVLKLGDYCSGWMPAGDHSGHPRRGPTQEQWDEWQHAREAERDHLNAISDCSLL